MDHETSRTKSFSPGGWESLMRACDGHFSSVFMRDDRVAIKEAASRAFPKKELDALRPPPTHFGVHRTIMGSEEGFGFNINGDSYPEKMLERDHPTFVSHGRVYREHENRDPRKSIGIIKAAKFNRRNQRVELVEWLEIAKAAKEYEIAKAGKELHASQSCRIPYDSCSICGNESKTPATYCDDLKFDLKSWNKQARRYVFMRNPKCTFFDSSVVDNPADITAKHHEYRFADQGGVMKAASQNAAQSSIIDAAVSAAHVFELSFKEACLLRRAALLEDFTVPNQFRDVVAVKAAAVHDISQQDLEVVRALEPGSLFSKLAQQRVLLPFDAFVAYTQDRTLQEVRADQDFQKAAASLPELFRTIADALEGQPCDCTPDDIDMLRPFDRLNAACDAGNSDTIDKAIEHMAQEAGFAEEPVRRRSVMVIVRSKQASAPRAFEHKTTPNDTARIALLYGAHKLASIAAMQLDEHEEDKMLAFAVAQNWCINT